MEQGGQEIAIGLRGRSEHTLDEKGRLNVPARVQEVLRGLGDERLMVVPWDRYLKAYPVPVWEFLEKRLLAEAQNNPGPTVRRMVEHLIGGVEECPLKRGRISLPARMRAEVGIEREVVLECLINVVRIWDKKRWEQEFKPTPDDFRRYDDRMVQFGTF